MSTRNGEAARRFRYWALYFLYVATAVVVPVELFVRYYFLSSEEFGIFRVEADQFPFFRLVDTYRSNDVTIRSGRRELLARGQRREAVAFVGDSVTFGTHVPDRVSYVEQIQELQSVFDAYNFGVPGYGILEIASVVHRFADGGQYSAIVYTFNLNDVFPAMATRLALLTTRENRFASMDRYDGWRGVLNQLAKDYFKSLLLLKETAGWLSLGSVESASESTPTRYCYEEAREMSKDEAFQKPNRVWPAMYGDPRLIERLGNEFRRMRAKAESSGARFMVAVSYDFLLFEDRTDTSFKAIVERVLHDSGVDVIDTHPVFQANYQLCDFFADPRHLGAAGSRLLAQRVVAALAERGIGEVR